MLAGLTQADLARAAECHPRSVRYWESKGSDAPTNVASTLDTIEQALNRHGVIAFSIPSQECDYSKLKLLFAAEGQIDRSNDVGALSIRCPRMILRGFNLPLSGATEINNRICTGAHRADAQHPYSNI